MLETLDHDLHKMRRDAMSGFFSKRSVQELESLVVQTVEKLCTRWKGEMKKPGSEVGVVNLTHAFAGMTIDVISEYSFGESMKALDEQEYRKEWYDILHDGVKMRPLGRQFPTLVNTLVDLPPWITSKLSSTAAKMNTLEYGIPSQNRTYHAA